MASTNDLVKSGVKGIFYREHPKRKESPNAVRKDRQWIVIQKVDGKRIVSTLGWSSDNPSWTELKAGVKAAEYKDNHRWNKANPDQLPRPICKQDEDDAAQRLCEKLERERKAVEHKNTTFGQFFAKRYLPLQYDNGKKSASKEEQLYRSHIAPVLKKFSFAEIKPLHVEKISKKMKDKGLAPRTIAYAHSLIRQVWNLAIVDGITSDQHPIGQVKRPKINNKRERFITEDEEALLLPALKARSTTMHDMTIISLDTGARWGELANLTWQNVDLKAQTARLMDTKAGDNRTIHTTTQRVMKMLDRRKHESDSPYVFPARDGNKQKQVNVVFLRTVRDLGLNDGIDDDRKKVCFHTMRHTFASRLAMAGVPLYTIKTAMGHHSIIMTERYAHLMPDTLREAMAELEKKPDNVIELKKSAQKP